MCEEKGTLALTEWNGGGPVMPSWGLQAPGSCSVLHGNVGSVGRADPIQCSQQDCPFYRDTAALIPIRGAATPLCHHLSGAP